MAAWWGHVGAADERTGYVGWLPERCATDIPTCCLCRMTDSPGMQALMGEMMGMEAELLQKVAPTLALWNAPGSAWLKGSAQEREVNASRALRAVRLATGRKGTELTGAGYFTHTAKIYIQNKFDGGAGFDCVLATMPSEEARAAVC